MLVAVGCGKCSKPFQVEESALGSTVTCPWCQASVAALPMAMPTAPTGSANQPLSLDQAVQLPSEAKPDVSSPPGKPQSPAKLMRRVFFLAVAMALAGFGGWFASRYGSGKIPEGAWRDVSPPGGDLRIKLPGSPEESELPADSRFPGLLAGKRFTVDRWYEDVHVSVGWHDIDPDRAKKIDDESLLAFVREARATQLGGKAIFRGTVQVDGFPGDDIEYETPKGPVFERLISARTAPKPRIYMVTVWGANQTLKGEGGKKSVADIAFPSLWLNEKARP